MDKGNNNKGTMKNKSKKAMVKKDSKNKNIKITKFEDLEGKFLHIKVGSSAEPASVEQISNIGKSIVELFEENNINCIAFVTHHAVSMDIVEKDSKR